MEGEVICMRRNAIQELIKWKSSEERKPMVLKGARQVGKTWLMKEFGQSCYESFVYFNFDEEDELKSIFEKNKNPHRIIELLSFIAEKKIVPGETLIIFDEIQECPEALNTLKYFKENANEYHVIAAGSLLGTLLAQPKSYPVGMVNLLDIHPLNFEEFLDAVEPALYAYYDNIQKNQQIEEIFHNRLLEAYNNYLIIGGMPECVASWIIVKEAGRVTSKRQSNGLFLPVCSIVYIMYQRWSILCPPSTGSINLNCFSLILVFSSIWRALITVRSF